MPSTILIGGGTGLIGRRLSELLTEEGHTVLHLSRSPRPDSEYTTYQWDVSAGKIDEEAVVRADYVINLAGAGIADQAWSEKRKNEIIESRTDSTLLFKKTFKRLKEYPRLYLSASAVGYYGDRGDKLLPESAAPGKGFLSRSCVLWEEAVGEVAALGIPTFILRTGVVLSTRGGAFPEFAGPTRFGISPYFGRGKMWYSWIHIDDLCRMYLHAIRKGDLAGVFNGVAPNPVRNREMAQLIPRAMGRKALPVPAPTPAIYLALGERAHVVLDSARCSAEKILATGYDFQFPQLTEAVADISQREV